MNDATAWCGLMHGSSGLVVLNVAGNNLEGSIPECFFDEDSKLTEFAYGELGNQESEKYESSCCLFFFSLLIKGMKIVVHWIWLVMQMAMFSLAIYPTSQRIQPFMD